MKHDIKNMQDRLDLIISMQETIIDKLNNTASYSSFLPIDDDGSNIIYIDSNVKLELMEEKLTDTTYRSKVVSIYFL